MTTQRIVETIGEKEFLRMCVGRGLNSEEIEVVRKIARGWDESVTLKSRSFSQAKRQEIRNGIVAEHLLELDETRRDLTKEVFAHVVQLFVQQAR